MSTSSKNKLDEPVSIALISLHGLIRGHNLELGRDADTGGQTRYVVELMNSLSASDQVAQVTLFTRQVIDEKISPDYAQMEEKISDKAKIVRLPFGPRRYIRKELLWPYLDQFVDQALSYFRLSGEIPNVIHGHYADAGYVGARLSSMLAVPFIFTGHSLGKVKRDKFMKMNPDPLQQQALEKKYNFTSRIEAEETALEHAAMVISSTTQEIQDQYKVYDHYAVDRMEVIPPGVDTDSFRPSKDEDEPIAFAQELERFLTDPNKPIVLALARPDEKKNLESLVRAFGESSELREAANLVLIMGNRDDVTALAPGARKVITNVLQLVDKYDLYGKVAYPKKHKSSEVPLIYRLVAKSKGIFINPAFNEPFGLTLLEAAAAGIPIVATDDGGPRDIIANCHNGLLVNARDNVGIQNALLQILTQPEVWEKYASNGLAGVHKHYSWKNHARRVLRDIVEIVQKEQKLFLNLSKSPRRLPKFKKLIIADIDNTLMGDDDAMHELLDAIRCNDEVGFGIATGRSFNDVTAIIEENNIPRPDLLITSVGTEIFYGDEYRRDNRWWKHLEYNWERDRIVQALSGFEGLYMQKDLDQSKYKISYRIDPELAPTLSDIRKHLRQLGIRAKTILSLNMFLDIIPNRGGSGVCVRHLAYKWGFSMEQILVAGDSGNDQEMLKGGTLGVVVGNYSTELEKLRGRPRIYFANGHHARGIIEGIDYYNFWGKVQIKNEVYA